MIRRLVAMLAISITGTVAHAQRAPQIVAIVGTDYAFKLPEHIRAGETIFTFENRGTVRHEFSVVRLKEGFGADSVLAGVVQGSPRRNWVDGQGALLIARPADPPGPGLWLNLQAGRTYIVVCTLRDSVGAQPHVMLGMLGSFRVEP